MRSREGVNFKLLFDLVLLLVLDLLRPDEKLLLILEGDRLGCKHLVLKWKLTQTHGCSNP